MFVRVLSVLGCLGLAGCGSAYIAPSVSTQDVSGVNVQVLPITARSVRVANSSAYTPKSLPSAFYQTAGNNPNTRGLPKAPDASVDKENRPRGFETRLPPKTATQPYLIGVGDVLLLATPSATSSVEELSGLLAAQNRRQGYTVQDDGSIAIPDVGRVAVAGLSLEEAEAEIFKELVANQIDPSFSLEIAEFKSKKVSIGGAVGTPIVAPITLTPLYLDEALAAAGGVNSKDLDYTVIRLYRNGNLYQIPLQEMYSKRSLQKILLVAGDSIFVDTEFELDRAQAYFAEQIALSNFKRSARSQALSELQNEFSMRSTVLDDQRDNFLERVELGASEREYVYLTGEVTQQARFPLPFEKTASLADALYDQNGFSTRTGNPSQIYVLRGSGTSTETTSVTAWHLDASNAVNIIHATRMELRPNDVIFIAEQPVTKWNRVLTQLGPSLVNSSVAAAVN